MHEKTLEVNSDGFKINQTQYATINIKKYLKILHKTCLEMTDYSLQYTFTQYVFNVFSAILFMFSKERGRYLLRFL